MCLTQSLIFMFSLYLPILQMEVSEIRLIAVRSWSNRSTNHNLNMYRDYLGECNKQTAFEMLDFFYENGGNFIDTANK